MDDKKVGGPQGPQQPLPSKEVKETTWLGKQIQQQEGPQLEGKVPKSFGKGENLQKHTFKTVFKAKGLLSAIRFLFARIFGRKPVQAEQNKADRTSQEVLKPELPKEEVQEKIESTKQVQAEQKTAGRTSQEVLKPKHPKEEIQEKIESTEKEISKLQTTLKEGIEKRRVLQEQLENTEKEEKLQSNLLKAFEVDKERFTNRLKEVREKNVPPEFAKLDSEYQEKVAKLEERWRKKSGEIDENISRLTEEIEELVEEQGKLVDQSKKNPANMTQINKSIDRVSTFIENKLQERDNFQTAKELQESDESKKAAEEEKQRDLEEIEKEYAEKKRAIPEHEDVKRWRKRIAKKNKDIADQEKLLENIRAAKDTLETPEKFGTDFKSELDEFVKQSFLQKVYQAFQEDTRGLSLKDFIDTYREKEGENFLKEMETKLTKLLGVGSLAEIEYTLPKKATLAT